MDLKPSLLPLRERQVRKALALRERGLPLAEIAAAMGLRQAEVRDLLDEESSAPKAEKGKKSR